jgi:hypothetical protein
MSTRPNAPTSAELVDEASNWAIGGGIVTLALFPLSIPGLIILLIGTIPLLLLAVPIGLLVALVALPILLVRGLVRRLTRALPRGDAPTSIREVGHTHVA